MITLENKYIYIYKAIIKEYNCFMYSEDGKIFIENDDQCINCKNYASGVSCPLLIALGQGVVCLEDCLTVTNCGFFKKFERTLRIVRNGD